MHPSPENCLLLQRQSSTPRCRLVLQHQAVSAGAGAGAKKHGQQHLQFGKFDKSVLGKSIQEQVGNRNIGDFVKTHNLLR